ncbi:MAG: circularly permuted type 2 ATP-grasp protein [Planctomycetaceae bacterium]
MPESGLCFDELLADDGSPRHAALSQCLKELSLDVLVNRQRHADEELLEKGVTFAVYGHDEGTEKIWPFDIVPRAIAWAEWQTVEAGLQQRIRALNLFLNDIYGNAEILKDGVVPESLIFSAKTYRPECHGLSPRCGVWTHVTGTDLIRHSDGRMYVLEDNLRCPSGVSYVLENRELMKRVLPEVFYGSAIAPIDDYPERLLQTLLETAPPVDSPVAVVLTPGVYNSAYFEHSFLAQQMGVELVTGSDLFVDVNTVYMKTTRGPKRVDVIYRRLDDDFLDPECFRRDSMLGVPGLMRACRAGRVTLANAPGTGIADDKAVYAYVPQIIKYYLNEEIILPNVPTWLCSDPEQRAYVLDHLDELVVKPTNESGGYGILMGPQASAEERQKCAEQIEADARNFIAQPMLQLSTVPTVIGGKLSPRRVDLRPFILYGEDVFVLPGGLTRVALKEGSMIVNSSQGGGSKDTWILYDNAG